MPGRGGRDVEDEGLRVDPSRGALREMPDEPPVPFGPRQEVGRLLVVVLAGEARRVVVDARPRGDPLEVRPEVVPAAVLGEPAEAPRREAVRVEPLLHRDAVQREEIGIHGGPARRDRERAAVSAIFAGREGVHRPAEARDLLEVPGRGALVREEPRMPSFP